MNISARIADERVADVRCGDASLIVDLEDGRTISVPLAWYPRLLHATPQQTIGLGAECWRPWNSLAGNRRRPEHGRPAAGRSGAEGRLIALLAIQDISRARADSFQV